MIDLEYMHWTEVKSQMKRTGLEPLALLPEGYAHYQRIKLSASGRGISPVVEETEIILDRDFLIWRIKNFLDPLSSVPKRKLVELLDDVVEELY